jgi:hypothetical protein
VQPSQDGDMPVVFRESGLRYFFYSNEGMPREPRMFT